MIDPRETTNKLIEQAEQGCISWEVIARTCLSYMSEDDVKDMITVNELLVEEPSENVNPLDCFDNGDCEECEYDLAKCMSCGCCLLLKE